MALQRKDTDSLLNQLKVAGRSMFQVTLNNIFIHIRSASFNNDIYASYELNLNFDTFIKFERGRFNLPITSKVIIDKGLGIPEDVYDAQKFAFNFYKYISQVAKEELGNKLNIFFLRESFSENLRICNLLLLKHFYGALNDIVTADLESEKPAILKFLEAMNNERKNVVLTQPAAIGSSVFIIHGHDNELKTEVQLLLTRAMVESVVLHEQPDKGRTIIEKLIGETERAGYAIALLTPDDLTKEGVVRARQNVILEIGYFLGKLGKDRIRLIVKGNIEIPSDLQGILYEKHDSTGFWKIKLLKEMGAAGIKVDLDNAMKTI